MGFDKEFNSFFQFGVEKDPFGYKNFTPLLIQIQVDLILSQFDLIDQEFEFLLLFIPN